MTLERATGHGSPSKYYKGCHCVECTLGANTHQKDWLARKAGKPFQPELTAAWSKAVELGIAGQLADRIVREREIPDKLCNLLTRLIQQDDKAA